MPRNIIADIIVNDRTQAGLARVQAGFRRTERALQDLQNRADNNLSGNNQKLAKFGIGLVQKFGKAGADITNAIGQAGAAGGPLMVAGVIASLPVLSGAIGAAVTAGIGTAAVGAGIAVAFRDARVAEAGKQLANNLLNGVTDRAGSFIQPVLNSIEILKAKFLESGDTIKSIFDNSAKFVEPLATALGELGQDLLEGIETGVKNAGPVMEALNVGIEGTGEALKSFIASVTAEGEANALVLERAFSSLNGTIVILGETLGTISSIFAEVDKFIPLDGIFGLKRMYDDLNSTASDSATISDATALTFQRVGDAAETAEADLKLYEAALRDNEKAAQDAASANASLFDDVTNVAEASARAKKAAKENGRTLDENTAKGRANRGALSALAGALNGYRTNLVKSGASADTVNRIAGEQRTRLIKVANSMGVAGTQAGNLANRLLGIPLKRDTKVTLNAGQVASEARNARQEIESIRGKSVTVTVNVNASRLASVEKRLARIGGGNLAAGDSFGMTEPGAGGRVGGPITVASEVSVNLDGRPFRQATATAISDNTRRERFRAKVGSRTGGRG